jgi:iron complex outermembrane receptor protein
LSYRITPDALLYLSYSEGFHSGGFFGVNQNTRDFIRDQYDPEFAESWELGFKSQWFDNRLRLNVTAFINEFTDKQESSVQQDPDTLTVASVFDNVANATYQGIELETEYVFNEYVRAFFNYGYLDAEYDEFETDINAADGVTFIEDASFLKPRNAPENTIGVGGTVSIPVGTGFVELYAKYSRVDDVETNLLNTPLGHLDAREDVTASLGYYAENFSVVAYGRNLTDERTEVFTPIATLFAAGSLNRPRTYGLEFTYEFNAR